ncbi:hypothetical protein ACVWYH_006164 [Bradyrhizobium sp. GM24.11]
MASPRCCGDRLIDIDEAAPGEEKMHEGYF